MKKRMFKIVFLLIFSIVASFLSVLPYLIRYGRTNYCGDLCPQLFARVGYPFNLNSAYVGFQLGFFANAAFYFLFFSAIYFGYTKITKKGQKK